MAGPLLSPSGVERGICTECGSPAYHHLATKCEEHRGVIKSEKASTRVASDVPRVDISGDTPRVVIDQPKPRTSSAVARMPGDKKERAAELEASILKDLNPALLQGFALTCKPIDPVNFYIVDNAGKVRANNIGEQIVITPMEAQILGKAAAELEASSIAQSAVMMAGPVLPIAYAVAALGVVAFHGYKLAGIRANLMQQIANGPVMTGPTGLVPEPSDDTSGTVGSPVAPDTPVGTRPIPGMTNPTMDASQIGTPQ